MFLNTSPVLSEVLSAISGGEAQRLDRSYWQGVGLGCRTQIFIRLRLITNSVISLLKLLLWPPLTRITGLGAHCLNAGQRKSFRAIIKN